MAEDVNLFREIIDFINKLRTEVNDSLGKLETRMAVQLGRVEARLTAIEQNFESRLDALERWRSWAAGLGVAISVLASAVISLVTSFLSRKLGK